MAVGSLRLLRNRNFALIWASGLVSNIGTWMQAVAVGALVTELTNSAGWGALVAAASFLASGLVTPLGGVLADRHDRRKLLLVVSLGSAVVASALAIAYVTSNVSPGVVIAVVALEGALVALSLPAHGAMLPDIVQEEQLVEASAPSGSNRISRSLSSRSSPGKQLLRVAEWVTRAQSLPVERGRPPRKWRHSTPPACEW